MKSVKMIAAALACSAILASCGGGTPKSGVKKNDILGNLPALYADNELAEEADETRMDKMRNEFKERGSISESSIKKFMVREAKIEKAADEREAKFESAKKAEWANIDGTEVPFTVSEAFAQSVMQVNSVKLDAEKERFVLAVVARTDFEKTLANRLDYDFIYYKALDKNGEIIEKLGSYLGGSGYKPVPIAAGQSLHFEGGNAEGYFNGLLSGNIADKYGDFASIEFITKEEYMALE